MRVIVVLCCLILAGIAASMLRPRGDVDSTTSDPPPSARSESRPEAPSRAAPPATRKRDALVDGLAGIIRDAASEDAEDLILQDRLVALLEAESIGDVLSRQQAAAETVGAMMRQASRSVAPSTPQQLQAVRAMAQRLAASFRSGLTDSGGKRKSHTGVLVGAAAEFEAPEGYEKISWSLLGGFDYREGMELPRRLMRLNGKKAAVAGYMIALGKYENIHEFVLVESQWSCCFGVPPEVNQVISVRIPDDQEGLDLISTPLVILGRFEVGEELEDGFVTSLYRIITTDVQEME